MGNTCKYLAVVLILVALLGLAACGSKPENGQGAGANPTASQEADGTEAGTQQPGDDAVMQQPTEKETLPETTDHIHVFGEWSVKESSCAAAGEKKRTCSVCDKQEVEVVPALPHTQLSIPGYAATCTKTGLTDGAKCSVCNAVVVEQQEIPMLKHTEIILPGFAATCTKAGMTDGKKCSVCLTVLVEQTAIPQKAHTPATIQGYAATCAKTGLTAGKKCSACGEILEAQKTIEKKPHTTITVPGYDATCSKSGLTDGVKCTVCLTFVTPQKTIKSLPHSYGSWVTTKEPTCSASGTKERVCSVCKDVEELGIPATGKHNYVNGICSCGEEIKGTDGLTYTLSSDQTYYICNGYNKLQAVDQLVIPSYYKGKPVKEIAAVSFTNMRFTEVVISEGIEKIGRMAFANNKVVTVKIPKSMKHIGEMAFTKCKNLETVYFAAPTGWKQGTQSYNFSDPYYAASILLDDSVSIWEFRR